MNKLTTLLFCVVVVALANASTIVTNFNDGTMQGWVSSTPNLATVASTAGSLSTCASQSGTVPVMNGDNFLSVESSAANVWISASLDFGSTLPQGTPISFDYNFITVDYLPYDDEGQIVADVCPTSNGVMLEPILTFSVGQLNGVKCTGKLHYEGVLAKETDKLVIRVRNIGDSAVESYVGIDNVVINFDNTWNLANTETLTDEQEACNAAVEEGSCDLSGQPTTLTITEGVPKTECAASNIDTVARGCFYQATPDPSKVDDDGFYEVASYSSSGHEYCSSVAVDWTQKECPQ